jgi:hypothetical protein
MTTLIELVQMHSEIAKTTKVQACKTQGGPCDLHHMMIWVDGNDKTNLAIVDVKGQMTEYMPKMLALVGEQSPKVVMFLAESLAYEASSVEEAEEVRQKYKNGEFAETYRELGPLSGLKELIAFNALDVITGEQVQGVVPFMYDDKGMPVFGETQVSLVDREHVESANVTHMFDLFYQFTVWKHAQS